jgi:hypothetical protein
MTLEVSFPRYLLSKQTVDDRALNRLVLDALRARLPRGPIRVIEVGAGMGNMLARLLSWSVISEAEYVHEDAMEENLRFASTWLPDWARQAGYKVTKQGESGMRLSQGGREVNVTLTGEDLSSFVRTAPAPADLLIAHAFLDLLPLPKSLPGLLSLTKNLAWLTLNFDGLTAFEPSIDEALDEQIVELYHRSMDARPTGGDSRTGRHLLTDLRKMGVHILAAGSSDWVVLAEGGKYPADEAYFLKFILHFFEEALTGHPELDQTRFRQWLSSRRFQVDHGELVYVAHQLDVLLQV